MSRMMQSGAFLTTSEAIIFQLVKDASHPKFKEIDSKVHHKNIRYHYKDTISRK
jgi:hypothetical protein